MREREKRRFGNETININVSDKYRSDIINSIVKNSFDKSRMQAIDKYGYGFSDYPIQSVSPEFDALTIGHAFINGFVKQLPKIILKKKNNKYPFSTRTQMRFSNANTAVRNEAINNSIENTVFNDY